jgi:hypothetical protein
MLANGVRHTTTDTGAGEITLAAVAGAPSFTDAFGAAGSRRVSYSICADASGQPGELIETGIGDINLATLSMTRVAKSTWSGGVYVAHPASPATLGAGTKHVLCSPTAETAGIAAANVPRVTGSLTRGMAALSNPASTTPIVTNGRLEVFSIYWPWCERFDRVRLRMSSAVTGATAPYFGVGVYEPTGPAQGRALAIFQGWGTVPITTTAVSVSNPLAAPIALTPGFYFVAMLAAWTGGTGSVGIVAGGHQTYPPGVFGTDLSNAQRATGCLQIGGQTALGASLPAGMSVLAVAQSLPYFLFDAA